MRIQMVTVVWRDCDRENYIKRLLTLRKVFQLERDLDLIGVENPGHGCLNEWPV